MNFEGKIVTSEKGKMMPVQKQMIRAKCPCCRTHAGVKKWEMYFTNSMDVRQVMLMWICDPCGFAFAWKDEASRRMLEQSDA